MPTPRDPDYATPGAPEVDAVVVDFPGHYWPGTPGEHPAHAERRPVVVGHDPRDRRVVVWLDYGMAEELAQILAQVDSNPNRTRDAALTVTKDNQDAWINTVIDLISAVRLASTPRPRPAVVRRLPQP